MIKIRAESGRSASDCCKNNTPHHFQMFNLVATLPGMIKIRAESGRSASHCCKNNTPHHFQMFNLVATGVEISRAGMALKD